MVTRVTSGKRHSLTVPSVLMMLPTPLDCMSRTLRSPPSHAPATRPMPSSSVLSTTARIESSAWHSSIRRLWPPSGTYPTRRIFAATSSRWIASGHILKQRLTGLHARELHRSCFYDKCILLEANAGERRGLQRPGLREVGAEVRAARIAPRGGRRGDRAACRDQALQVHPVVPAQIEGAIMIREAVLIERRFERGELALRLREPARVADDADLFPHQVIELVPDRLKAA